LTNTNVTIFAIRLRNVLPYQNKLGLGRFACNVFLIPDRSQCKLRCGSNNHIWMGESAAKYRANCLNRHNSQQWFNLSEQFTQITSVVSRFSYRKKFDAATEYIA